MKKMKKSIFSVLVLSIAMFMSSCGFEDGAGYINDMFVEKTDKVEALLLEAYNYIDVDEYDSALAYLDSVTNYVKESEIIIAKLKNKSAEKFQKFTLEYLAFYDAAVVDYKQAIEWFQSEDDELFEKANKLIIDFGEKAEEKLDEFVALQAEFAKANNLELDKSR